MKNIENSNVVHLKITKEIDVNCVKFIWLLSDEK
jgi:hypothetical protein